MFLRPLDHNTGSALKILDHVGHFVDRGDIVVAVLADVLETSGAVAPIGSSGLSAFFATDIDNDVSRCRMCDITGDVPVLTSVPSDGTLSPRQGAIA